MRVKMVCRTKVYLFSNIKDDNMLTCEVYQRNEQKEHEILKTQAFYSDNIPYDCPVISAVPDKVKFIYF